MALAGIVTTLVGAALSSFGWLLAQTAGDTGADFGPWVSAGGSATAVAGIVYIAKLMADGKLVARDPAASEQRLTSLTETSHQLVIDAHQREATYVDVIRGQR